jgi:hypothetical protein
MLKFSEEVEEVEERERWGDGEIKELMPYALCPITNRKSKIHLTVLLS